MRFTPLESGRSFLQTTECAMVSVFAHGVVAWLATALLASGWQVPADERDARLRFLLPLDRNVALPFQTEIFQLGTQGIDLDNGADLTHADAGPYVRPQTQGARGREEGSGARGAIPFGPVSKLPFDTVFSALQVDRTVERYEWSEAPAYPSELAALGTEGVVRAVYVVDTTGTVDTTSIRVLYSDDPLFTASVMTALGRMRFRPAMKAGKPVLQEVAQQFRFRIRALMGVPGSTAS
jgi:TonB family protein